MYNIAMFRHTCWSHRSQSQSIGTIHWCVHGNKLWRYHSILHITGHREQHRTSCLCWRWQTRGYKGHCRISWSNCHYSRSGRRNHCHGSWWSNLQCGCNGWSCSPRVPLTVTHPCTKCGACWCCLHWNHLSWLNWASLSRVTVLAMAIAIATV